MTIQTRRGNRRLIVMNTLSMGESGHATGTCGCGTRELDRELSRWMSIATRARSRIPSERTDQRGNRAAETCGHGEREAGRGFFLYLRAIRFILSSGSIPHAFYGISDG
jgi:hypothetical protein